MKARAFPSPLSTSVPQTNDVAFVQMMARAAKRMNLNYHSVLPTYTAEYTY